MTKREQTTKEREAQEGTAKQQRAKHTARVVLGTLMATRSTMAQFPSKEARKVSEDVNNRIAWLIAENETYRDVAAEMWLGGQQGYDGCVEVARDSRSLDD